MGVSARRVGREACVHVMIDTGMGREGALPEHVPALVEHVRRTAGLKLTGLYTHFATADEADKSFTREQLARFRQAVSACGPTEGLTLHAASSAGLIDLPKSHLDTVCGGCRWKVVADRLPTSPSRSSSCCLLAG